jgi:hypothetical protein
MGVSPTIGREHGGFRVKTKVRRLLERRKRAIQRRLKRDTGYKRSGPVLAGANVGYALSERVQATHAGGIAAIHAMSRQLGLDEAIQDRLHLFKLHLPYRESDHVLNIAYNLLAGGSCLEHLELLRQDEAYLNALGADRVPDPTTAGDFCRRFSKLDVFALMEAFNEVRLKLWQRQESAFFDEAIIDADGTMVETTGECKQGMDICYKGQWGYHPLVVSLANTGEPLYVLNRSGNRPSHENADLFLDQSIALCRRAGFRKITLRGDTDFTQTEHLDRWDGAGVRFVFGIDAMRNLYEIAENLPQRSWQRLQRRSERSPQRKRPANAKQPIIEDRGYKNIRLQRESVAEFRYSPTKCRQEYRVVVVRKDLEVTEGQIKLFDDERCFFYITNDWSSAAADIVRLANGRCDQENLIQQLKSGVRALTAPVDNLASNWAYMVMASLAWSLKAWAALHLPESGRWRERHREEKQRLLRMDFDTFRRCIIQIPAQIARSGRQLICRLLAWNEWQGVFLRLTEQLHLPLRC